MTPSDAKFHVSAPAAFWDVGVGDDADAASADVGAAVVDPPTADDPAVGVALANELELAGADEVDVALVFEDDEDVVVSALPTISCTHLPASLE